jgi:hypothetical protein
MGLNLSDRQIARELGLDGSDVQAMTGRLRRGLVAKVPAVRLEGKVEIGEVCVVAGHNVTCRHHPGSQQEPRFLSASDESSEGVQLGSEPERQRFTATSRSAQ